MCKCVRCAFVFVKVLKCLVHLMYVWSDNRTKPMQFIPISAVPKTNSRGPQPHYYTERERGREMSTGRENKHTHSLTHTRTFSNISRQPERKAAGSRYDGSNVKCRMEKERTKKEERKQKDVTWLKMKERKTLIKISSLTTLHL